MSRQLWWGHRIPAYSVIHGDDKVDGDNDDIFSSNNSTWIIARSEEEAHSRAREKYGDTVSLHQDSDVLDTWFSSSIVPFATLGWPRNVSLYHSCDIIKYINFIIFSYTSQKFIDGRYDKILSVNTNGNGP